MSKRTHFAAFGGQYQKRLNLKTGISLQQHTHSSQKFAGGLPSVFFYPAFNEHPFKMKKASILLASAMVLLCAISSRAQVQSGKHQSKPKIDHGQRWQKLWSEGKPFTEVRAAFYEDYADVPADQIPRYKQFKRVENLMLPRLGSDGHHRPGTTIANYKTYKQTQDASRAATANWSFVGPATVPSFVNFQEGIGRVDRISWHPTDPNTYWIGTPTQGLWKTTTNGSSWTAIADDWTGLGMGDVVIDPTGPDTLYVATGCGDVGAISPFGIMKSIDGGATFATSGLTALTSIHKLIIDPANSSRLFAATNGGLYVTTDRAATWTLHAGLPAGIVYDIEFKPGDPTVMYLTVNNAGSVEFRKSTDSGATFSSITMPYTASNISRTLIAVTPHDPTYVYVLTASAATAGMEGVYRSTNSGGTFTKMSNGSEALTYPNGDPHVFTVTDVVSTNSAWGWILGVNPLNKDDVYIGAVWICRSTDGGTSWQDVGDSNHGGLGIHVDFHDIKWHPTTNLMYIASDGGIYRDNGTWPIQNISEGLGIQQNYTLASTQDGTQILTGNQDNGTFLYNGTNWIHWGSGDGMTCFFDPGNSSTVYGSLQTGLGILKSTNSGVSAINILSTVATGQTAGWEVQFTLHPFFRNHIFAGYEDVWKSTDGGTNWVNLTNGALTGTGPLTMLQISEADPNIMVAGSTTGGRYYKTVDGGSNWTELTNLNGFVLDLILHPTNANIMWATNTAIGEVAKSVDGGATWTDISGSLPANITNCIVYQKDSPNEALYVGQDLGIYYLDNTLGDWVLFDQNLPSVIVRELEVLPCTGKLRAATYGRGVWESDLYTYTPASACCPPAIPTLGTVSCNSNAVLTAAAAPSGYGYKWYKDDVLMPSETSQTLTASSTGNYYAVYDDATCDSYHSDGVGLDFSVPTVESSAMLGDALDMDGTGDYLSIPHSNSLLLGNSFTIEFWASSSANLAGFHYILRKEVAYGIDLVNGNDLGFITWGDDVTYTDGFLNDGDWHHYAFVADGGTQKRFYRDGKLIDTNNSAFFTDQATTTLHVGFVVNPAQMQIDEVRIWNDARTEAEIQNNAFCSIDCRTDDLVLYLPFEDGSANGNNTGITTVRDYSSHRNHASINGLALSGSASNFVSGAKTGPVTGATNVCANVSESFEVASIPAATGYAWTLPSGWTGSSSNNTLAPGNMLTSGTVSVDATLSCGNATFSKAVSSYGVCKTALQFDAIDDQVDLGTGINLANTSWTIEFWNKLDAPIGGADFILCGGTQLVNQGLNIGFTSGSFFTMGFWGDDLNLSTSYTDQEWHHWACVFNAATDQQIVYRDGVQVGIRTTNNGDFVGPTNLHIGRATWGETANITIDELRFWEDVRTPLEIASHMNSEMVGNEAGLIAYYDFEDATPEANNSGTTTILDKGTGGGRAGNNGALIGFGLNGVTSNFVFAKNGINTTLPVELTYLRGKQVSNHVQLHWQTQSELNNDRFVVEKLSADMEWNEIGSVAGQGTTSMPHTYRFKDDYPDETINFYRLQQVDYDGRSEHSESVAVDFVTDGSLPTYLHPNPVSNQLHLENAEGTITIFDLYGKRVRQVAATGGTTHIDVESLATGMYSVRIDNGRGTLQVLSFVK